MVVPKPVSHIPQLLHLPHAVGKGTFLVFDKTVKKCLGRGHELSSTGVGLSPLSTEGLWEVV